MIKNKRICSIITSAIIFTTIAVPSYAKDYSVIPSGEIIGMVMKIKHPFVEDTPTTENTILNKLDIITSIETNTGDISVGLEQIEDTLDTLDEEVTVRYLRENKEYKTKCNISELREYEFEDNLVGICTMTTVDTFGRYTAMSHAPTINNTNIELIDGTIYETIQEKGTKSKKGSIGFLNAKITENEIGTIDTINNNTIKGSLNHNYKTNLNEAETASPKVGKAYIYSPSPTTNEIEAYEIKITEIKGNLAKFKVVDKELIKHRGGVVQGMSGSPAIQNGKIVGGLKFVELSNPKVGYIININEILK